MKHIPLNSGVWSISGRRDIETVWHLPLPMKLIFPENNQLWEFLKMTEREAAAEKYDRCLCIKFPLTFEPGRSERVGSVSPQYGTSQPAEAVSVKLISKLNVGFVKTVNLHSLSN